MSSVKTDDNNVEERVEWPVTFDTNNDPLEADLLTGFLEGIGFEVVTDYLTFQVTITGLYDHKKKN